MKIWFFHGKDLLNNKPNLAESKKPYFKEALCYDKEEGINKLEEFLTKYLNNYEEHKLDYYDLQIDTNKFLEDYANRLYKAHKNLPIVSERRGFNEIEHSCVDCVDVDGSRIQEKYVMFRNVVLDFTYIYLNRVVGILNLREPQDLIMRMILIY